MTARQLRALSARAELCSYDTAGLLFREGDAADAFYIVMHGAVGVSACSIADVCIRYCTCCCRYISVRAAASCVWAPHSRGSTSGSWGS